MVTPSNQQTANLPVADESFSPKPMVEHSFVDNPSAHAGYNLSLTRPSSVGTPGKDYSRYPLNGVTE